MGMVAAEATFLGAAAMAGTPIWLISIAGTSLLPCWLSSVGKERGPGGVPDGAADHQRGFLSGGTPPRKKPSPFPTCELPDYRIFFIFLHIMYLDYMYVFWLGIF